MKRLLSSPLFLTIYCWTSWYISVFCWNKIGKQQDVVDTNLERFYCLAAISLYFLTILINILIYRRLEKNKKSILSRQERLEKSNYRIITYNIFKFINYICSFILFGMLPSVFLVSLLKFLESLG